MKQLTHGSLFAGIGGFDLGFERAGFKTVWQVEIDPYCRAVLAKHFPEAERFEDVREVGAHNLKVVDVITGGFPCQDISDAGKRVGIDGERSGLWQEMRRVICEVRPRFVVVENVSALLHRGIERVLWDLAAGGYDAEWDVLPACAFGAPHIRERVWILAYPRSEQYESGGITEQRTAAEVVLANSDRDNGHRRRRAVQMGRERSQAEASDHGFGEGTEWRVEPDVGRVAHGVPARVDRLKGLGNAVIPQIAQWIAERILEATCSAH